MKRPNKMHIKYLFMRLLFGSYKKNYYLCNRNKKGNEGLTTPHILALRITVKRINMKNINFKELEKKINYNDYTAFVYKDGTQTMYSGGEINEDTLSNFAKADTISICDMNELPDIKELMQANLLSEFKPAHNVSDDGYKSMIKDFEEGNGQIAMVENEKGITYMLVW